MRGKVAQAMGNTFDAGITPAYAGKSLDQIANDIAVLGSPPRMRGKEIIDERGLWSAGITPAYAGKRANTTVHHQNRWDHPRVCGEKSILSQFPFNILGSPPRMRGKDHGGGAVGGRGGITPAYAGKSPPADTSSRSPWDHPRVCGEKCLSLLSGVSGGGSPPRMRGKVPSASPGAMSIGITPAYAGKSPEWDAAIETVGDHPRVCGEKWGAPFATP